jgi:hypothetical protein
MATLKKNPVYDWTNFIIGYECISKEIKILVCKKSQADEIIVKHHYSKKPTKNSFCLFWFTTKEIYTALCN